MRSLFVVLCFAVVFSFTILAAGPLEGQEPIEVRPPDPRPTDVFEIAVHHSTSCPTLRVESRVAGRVVVVTWVEGGPCLPGLPTFETESVFVGPLAVPGTYSVRLFVLHEEVGIAGLPALIATGTFEVRVGGGPGRLSLEPARPTLEDPVRLTVRSPCPAQTSVDPPEISDRTITVVERVNGAILAPCFDHNVDVEKFELGTLDPGDYTVQLFTVETDPLGKGEVPEDPGLEAQLTVTEAPPKLVLANGRFTVEARWKEPGGNGGFGQPMELTGDTGYFWFFDPDNVEVVVKVLNACSFADRFWVFAAGLTNVEVELTVFDTLAQVEQVYRNPLRRPFEPIQDTHAFATCNALP